MRLPIRGLPTTKGGRNFGDLLTVNYTPQQPKDSAFLDSPS